MRKRRELGIFAVVVLLLGLSPPLRAQDISPQSGTWVIDEERTGKPGRGFQIEVQNDILVLYFYGYEGTGSSAYWLAAGTLAPGSNEFSADLGAYERGMAFGDPAKDAVHLGSRGRVTIRFHAFDRGEICLPDEPCKAISAFNFGYDESASALLGRWLVTIFAGERAFTVELEFTQLHEPYPGDIDRVSGTATSLTDSEFSDAGAKTSVECSRLLRPDPEPYFCRLDARIDGTETFLTVTRNALVGRYHLYGGPWVEVIGFRLASGSGRQLIPN